MEREILNLKKKVFTIRKVKFFKQTLNFTADLDSDKPEISLFCRFLGTNA